MRFEDRRKWRSENLKGARNRRKEGNVTKEGKEYKETSSCGRKRYAREGKNQQNERSDKEKSKETKDDSRRRATTHAGLPKALLKHINIRGEEVKKGAFMSFSLSLCPFRSGGDRTGQVVSGDENSHPKSASPAITHTHTHTHTLIATALYSKNLWGNLDQRVSAAQIIVRGTT
jgi:hypothetical protein